MNSPVLELVDVHKSYHQGETPLHVLQGVSLTIPAGKVVSLVGPSGCGKSTLLQIAGLLDRADSGSVRITGQETTTLPDRKRTALRRTALGFVYQFHHLLPELSALENVVLPQLIAGASRNNARQKAENLLDELGLKARMRHRPAELSGGEQQRVAIARALANQPALLLADEPTGNLDPHTASTVFNLLLHEVRQHQLSMLLVTHNLELARQADQCITLQEGRVFPL
ncbi:MAG: ABC transporter ATP-binding protein [Rickettsiales bacterium]|nr:ABC transporter ATP-binding protein [Rickettsiales bacterium]